MFITVQLEDFKYWQKQGSFYQGHKHLMNSVEIDDQYMIDSDVIEDMNDFIRVFDASNFYGLYKYPVELYIFLLLNKDNVVDFLQNRNRTYDRIFLKNNVYNQEIFRYKEDILSYMKFKLVYLYEDKSKQYIDIYEKTIEILEKTDFIDIKYEAKMVKIKDDFFIKNEDNVKIEVSYKCGINTGTSIFELKKYYNISDNLFNNQLLIKNFTNSIKNRQYMDFDDFSFENDILKLYDGSITVNITYLNVDLYVNIFETLYNDIIELAKKHIPIIYFIKSESTYAMDEIIYEGFERRKAEYTLDELQKIFRKIWRI